MRTDSTIDTFRSVTAKRKRLAFSNNKSSKRKLEGSAIDKDWTQVSNIDVRCFLNLLEDPIIKSFHMHDVCCMSSDQYLIAMTFVYFKKTKLHHHEFTRENFFMALYLAHEIEEETEEHRWEILPWALGKDWSCKFNAFIHGKNELWRKMDFKGIVSKKTCLDIITLEAMKNHSAFARVRISDHGEIRRQLRSTSYRPHGPLWHTVQGRAWLLREKSQMSQGDPTMQNCNICHGSNPKVATAIAKNWLMTDEIRKTFLRAANILDPDWMTITYGGDGDRSRNLSTIETGLDLDSTRSEDCFRNEVDGIISRLAHMTPSPPSFDDDEDDNLFPEFIPEESVKRKPSSDEEAELFIDCHQVKRGKFEANLVPINLYSILFGE